MNSVTSSVVSKRPLSLFAVPGCAACMAQRWHTDEEQWEHHPLAGHGFTPETGWTDPRAKAAHEAELREREAKDAAATFDYVLYNFVYANAKNASLSISPEAK